VSHAIRNFANERGFDFASWYHDEPIWFVRKDDGCGFFQQVQVAAFVTSEGPLSLFFVPLAYVIERKHKLRITPPDVTLNAPGLVSPQGAKGDKIPIAELMKLSPDEARERIHAALSFTWQQTILLHKQQAVS
jgi:hypothetical protein